ncbi:MAG: GPW/gp25 family protein [Mariprofundus sp.]|nr:GPW/gp25 family protein [Mariprofundus sp.]
MSKLSKPSEIPFLGTGWGFPPSFSKATRSVALISDEQDINSSLEILLSTSLGERVMQPSYGCDLKQLLFEPLNTSLKTYIKDLIKTAILYFEARIKLDNIILLDKQLEGLLEIKLEYTVRATNSRYNYVYPFYINEGTNIER